MTATASKEVEASAATPLRTGASFLDDLRTGDRTVFVDGELVKDPTKHRAFANGARTFAGLFDYAAAPENRERMTYTSPDTGGPVWRCFQIPRSHADLRTDGPHAGPCGELLRRLCGQARVLRTRRRRLCRQRREFLQVHSRQPQIRRLRDRPAADRPQQARTSA